MLKIHNTLTKQKEEFRPQKPPEVKMYTCGVTVYDDCHIGHGRSLYIFEVMKRYLEFRGYKVEFIRNITDVDDKIINKAGEWSKKENIPLKDAFDKVRKTYIDSYHQDLKLLDIPRAKKEPLATENIKEMQAYIQKLIEKGFAYEAQGNVYFSVRKFTSYGKLSGKKIDDLFSSVRIEPDPLKKDPLDFALWKKAKPDEPYWQSPWGKGRPGWHIECSVMSQKFLRADTLDIHGGGRDLVFPHHENECAQSQSLTGKTFANYWIHHGLLTINGQKMAKSLGNFITIKDVLAKFPANIMKIFYLGAHYSSPMDFSWERIEEAKKAYERIDILMGKLENIKAAKKTDESIGQIAQFKEKFIEAMDDDFNMPKGLAVLFDLINHCNKLLEEGKAKKEELACAKKLIDDIAKVFCFGLREVKLTDISEKEIEEKIKLRLQYRKEKKFKEADKIRKDLEEKGIILEDTKEGTEWRKKL